MAELENLADRGLTYMVRFSKYSGYSPIIRHGDGFYTYMPWYHSHQRAHCEGFNACIRDCAAALRARAQEGR